MTDGVDHPRGVVDAQVPAPCSSLLPPSSTSNPARRLMKDAGKSEDGEKVSPPLQIDPTWYARPHFLTRVAVR